MALDDLAANPGAARVRKSSPLVAVLALLLVVLFAGLGTWQVVRLQWKLDLIARVDARVHASPAPMPAVAAWAGITPESAEYRRVQVRGTYLYDLTTPVQALTEAGSGYWLLTPLCTADGAIVLVNRGFIPAELGARTRYTAQRASGNPCPAAGASAGAVTITGLLRTSEKPGPFSRANKPQDERWYIRDVAALARARGLDDGQGGRVAPFFIDAAAGVGPAGAPDRPLGGLTVVSFPNNHLMYAVTWYVLALMVAGAWWWVLRRGARWGTMGDARDD